MALSDTGKAIGKVTELLKIHLETRLVPPLVPNGFQISVGRPEADRQNPGLNLFLYEALFDASLKNVSLTEGQEPPLWLVLRYLMTPFDNQQGDSKESDSLEALEFLGEGIKTIQELNYMEITSTVSAALQDNPEPLKITFNEASADLLSKLMQGGDEKYRFSMVFEVRPVMIATGEPPTHALLVGIDYSQTPSQELEEEEKGVHIDVLPAMGPEITTVSPTKFEVNETVSVYGNHLDQAGLSVRLGPVELGATAQQPGNLQFNVNDAVAGGEVISAGSHPLKVVKTLAFGRLRSSNLLVANLLPQLNPGLPTVDSLALDDHPYLTGQKVVTATITLEGLLLGTDKDDIIVSFYREGKTTGIIEVAADPSVIPPQTRLNLIIEAKHKVPQGVYRLILLVNGQQARRSPQVDLTVP